MSIIDHMRIGGARFTRAAMAGVLAVGLMPLPAFAADLQSADANLTTQDAMNADGYVIAAAYAAANPAPEILGLNNPNQRSTQEAEQTYNFFGDPEINVNPDPYLYNTHNDLTPSVVIGGRAARSPMARLDAYDTENTEAAQNAVWALAPHIILGTSNDVIPENEHDYYAEDARTVETALGWEANSFNPIGVTYNRVNLASMTATMYRLAAAANEVVAGSDGELDTRYEDPMEIAKDYERYILGQKGVVLQYLASHPDAKKTIALVQTYDSDAGTYTVITDGVAEGTATTNRFLEAVQGVTDNYYDVVGEEGSTKVTAQQLKDNVDVIIIGTAAGTESEGLQDHLLSDGLLDKTYYCVNWANGSAFGTTVNSVENAQNVGRILPCVYPELLDQSDMIYYYYDVFYHLEDGKIPSIIDERMDGVRNWEKTDSASYTAWDAADVAGYDYEDVENLLKGGIAFLNKQTGLPDYLKPTANVASDSAASASSVELSEYATPYTGEAIAMPESQVKVTGSAGKVTFKYYTDADCKNEVPASEVKEAGTYYVKAIVAANGTYAAASSDAAKLVVQEVIAVPTAKTGLVYTGKELTGVAAGTGYTVKTGSATNAGDYTATATADATHVFTGGKATADVKWSIAKANQTVSVSSAKVSKTFGDAAFSIGAKTNGDGKLTYKSSDEKVASVDASGKVTIKGAGSATITAAAAATTNYKAASATVALTVAKAAQSITVSKTSLSKTYGNKAFALGAKLAKGDGKLAYKTSSAKVATVNANGKVTIKGAGKATITVSAAATSNYKAAAAKKVTLDVAKKANTLTVKAVKATQKAKAGKATTIKAAKAFKVSKNVSKGKVTYKKTSGNAKIKVSSAGKVTVAKGLKAGKTYTVKVKATSKATANYKAASKTITFKVKVTK